LAREGTKTTVAKAMEDSGTKLTALYVG